MAAACVFVGACRCAGTSRLLAEVVELARVDVSRVDNAYGVLNIELGLPAPPTTPTQFVPRIATDVDCQIAFVGAPRRSRRRPWMPV